MVGQREESSIIKIDSTLPAVSGDACATGCLRKPLFYDSSRAITRRPSQEIMGEEDGAEPVPGKTPPLRVGVHVELDDRNQSAFRRLADFYFQKPL